MLLCNAVVEAFRHGLARSGSACLQTGAGLAGRRHSEHGAGSRHAHRQRAGGHPTRVRRPVAEERGQNLICTEETEIVAVIRQESCHFRAPFTQQALLRLGLHITSLGVGHPPALAVSSAGLPDGSLSPSNKYCGSSRDKNMGGTEEEG